MNEAKKKMCDFIDACVWVNAYAEDGMDSLNYLSKVGYKNRNSGLITVPICGEISVYLTCKVPPEKKELMPMLSGVIHKAMLKLRDRNRLTIIKYGNINDNQLKEIIEKAYRIDEDDALHIAFAINHSCQNFITMDQKLLNNINLLSWLRKEKKVNVRLPYY